MFLSTQMLLIDHEEVACSLEKTLYCTYVQVANRFIKMFIMKTVVHTAASAKAYGIWNQSQREIDKFNTFPVCHTFRSSGSSGHRQSYGSWEKKKNVKSYQDAQ